MDNLMTFKLAMLLSAWTERLMCLGVSALWYNVDKSLSTASMVSAV